MLRFLDVTLFLAFQGDNSPMGDVHIVHNGNFMGILEFLGKYDEITREHLSTVKKAQIKGDTFEGSLLIMEKSK